MACKKLPVMQFIFKHTNNVLLPFLTETERHIKTLLAGRGDRMFVEKCKFILTELCTNGIKHSGAGQSIIEIYTDDSRLIIEKKDNGSPLCPLGYDARTALQLLQETDMLVLSEDDNNRLVMRRFNGHTVNFYAEDAPLTSRHKQQDLTEHFGLIIICRASQHFSYSHLPNGMNVFTVTLEIT